MALLNTENYINQRIDKSLSIDANIIRNFAQKIIKSGNLKKNGVVWMDNSYKIKEGDIFEYQILEKVNKIEALKIDLSIVYEDEDVLVIDKPPNLMVHPNGKNDTNTLVNALVDKYKLSTIGGEFRPGIVHRLDKDTTGLMVIAKNDISHLNLKKQLQDRILKRKYIGILWGVLGKQGKMEYFLKKEQLKMKVVTSQDERYSLTHYKTLETFLDKSLSMVEFELDTGRTHQIRVHCSHEGCPIIGDKVYGGTSRYLKKEFSTHKNLVEKFERQALHSYKLTFRQPTTDKLLEFKIEIPNDMKHLLDKLK
ncbi:MAG: RluA family pseudouridine synthase [Rickettsiales bacterium]|jgi:23S rRNA pseudouridine1911/1915/1917 synthase|nr:RluA family pseudouridine synthase [Rickettsiales bacterium]